MTCKRRKRAYGCKGASAVHRQCPGIVQTPGKLLHVIASLQTLTPARLQHVIARSEATWQSASPAAAQTEKQFFPANTEKLRICPGDTFLQTLTPARLQHVIARSEATWQSVLLAVGHDREQLFPANTEKLQICPMYYCLARYFCGDADCRTSVRTGSQ